MHSWAMKDGVVENDGMKSVCVSRAARKVRI